MTSLASQPLPLFTSVDRLGLACQTKACHELLPRDYGLRVKIICSCEDFFYFYYVLRR